MTEVKVAIDAKATLGEGSLWNPKAGVLHWVDINKGEVHTYNPSTKEDKFIVIGQMVGALGIRKSGGLVVALHHGFAFLDLETQKLTPIANPEKEIPTNRMNDGKVCPAGRFYAGTIDTKDAEKNKASFYVLNADHSVRKLFGDVTISNGLIWSPDNKTMYYIDSPLRTIDAFDYDINTGDLSNRRTIISVPPGDDVPDGMTIDADGNLWVAHWGATPGKVTQWNPNTKQLIRTIEVPTSHVTSVSFGGPDLEDLYITSAREGLSEEQLASQPHAGALFVCRPGVKGLPPNEFAG